MVETVEDDLLVYDLRVDKAHSLSAPAARVWRRCDGATSVDDLGADLGLDADTVARALDELDRANLLDFGLDPTTDGTTRREATIRMAKIGGAAAAAPLIVSLGLPAAAAAQTVTPELCTGGGLSHGCGIDCSPHDGSKCGCCCCQQTSTPPALCSGDTKCCLPKTQCEALVWGPNSNCSDISTCV